MINQGALTQRSSFRLSSDLVPHEGFWAQRAGAVLPRLLPRARWNRIGWAEAVGLRRHVIADSETLAQAGRIGAIEQMKQWDRVHLIARDLERAAALTLRRRIRRSGLKDIANINSATCLWAEASCWNGPLS